jgi:hypothetical protein
VTALRRQEAGGPSWVLARPRIWCETLRALAALSVTCRLNVSFRSNQTPSQRRASCSPSLWAVVIGWIVRSSLTSKTVDAGRDSWNGIVIPSFRLFNSDSAEDSQNRVDVLLGAEKVLGREVR